MFPKLMYYQMGVHPPPIQKLSHGDIINDNYGHNPHELGYNRYEYGDISFHLVHWNCTPE
jgi:hypothetical protein